MNKKENDFDFANKTQKIAKVKFPDSTDEVFIIPANKDGIGFQSKKYDENILGKHIDQQTFDSTIMRATKISRDMYRSKMMEERFDFTAKYHILLILAVFFVVLAFILLLSMIYGSREMDLVYAALVMIIVASIITLIVVIKIWTLNPEFMNLDKITKQKLTDFFNQENIIYQNKGYKWQLEQNLYWVELQKI